MTAAKNTLKRRRHRPERRARSDRRLFSRGVGRREIAALVAVVLALLVVQQWMPGVPGLVRIELPGPGVMAGRQGSWP